MLAVGTEHGIGEHVERGAADRPDARPGLGVLKPKGLGCRNDLGSRHPDDLAASAASEGERPDRQYSLPRFAGALCSVERLGERLVLLPV